MKKRIALSLWTVFVAASFAQAKPYLRVDWTWGPVLPTAQTALGAVAIGQDIIIVGGTYWVDRRDGVPTKIWSDLVWKLNSDTKQWSSLPNYPIPLGEPLVIADGKTVWVIGGSSENKIIAETYSLDLSLPAPEWRPGPSLPAPRLAANGGALNGMIYVAAGTVQSEGISQPATDILRLDTHDLRRGWQYVTDVPGPKVDWRSGTIVGDTLYLFGGLVTPNPPKETPEEMVRVFHNEASLIPRSESCAFEINSGRWKSLRPLPTAMGSGGCVAIDEDHLLLTGGIALAIPRNSLPDCKMRTYFSNECLLYNTKKDQYEKLTSSLRICVVGHGTAAINSMVYVIGGEDSTWKTRTDFIQVGRLRLCSPLGIGSSLNTN